MLHAQGALHELITDSWVSPRLQPYVAKISKSLSLRRHNEIPDHKVRSATCARLFLDSSMRAKRLDGWPAIIHRNNWFQKWAVGHVKRAKGVADVCFSYSYTARLPFQMARDCGMRCVLGQIDPGPIEHEVVDSATQQYEELRLNEDTRPSQTYWDQWRNEVEMSDVIVVNSEWSKELLVRQEIPVSKIRVVPLAYEAPACTKASRSVKPGDQDITVLFLGQVILRKGIGQLFDAIRLLSGASIRFVIAGPIGVKVPQDLASNPRVTFTGSVDGATARKLYQQADVFILPTLSDGFAITQLEALAYGVPVIASRYCGDVVNHGETGLLLDAVTGESIAETLLGITQGDNLAHMQANASVPPRFQLDAVGKVISDIA